METRDLVDQMIMAIADDQNTEAMDNFNAAIGAKIQDALSQVKQELAQNMFSDT